MVSIDYLRRSPEIDGAAIVEHVSYEGQGPMILESLVCGEGKRVLLPLTEDCNGVRRLGWKPLFAHFLDGSYPSTVPAARVHYSLAHSIVDQARWSATGKQWNSLPRTDSRVCRRMLLLHRAA